MAGAINPVDIRPGVLGNLKVNNLDSGQNSRVDTFWRGDGHWAQVGYGAGSGGVVAQTGAIGNTVTINKITGQITTVSNAFTAGARVAFQVNNSTLAATDVPVLATLGGATADAVNVTGGSFSIVLNPISTATFSVIINFCIIKGANS